MPWIWALPYGNGRPLDLSVGGCGAFPNPKQPSVIWLGLNGDTQGLIRMAAKTEVICEAHGFPREKRAFKPHLTLGRARRGKGSNTSLAPLSAAIARRSQGKQQWPQLPGRHHCADAKHTDATGRYI